LSAVEALRAARAAGIQLGIDGEELILMASAPPPAAVLDTLSRHKAEIVALLRPGRDGWSAEDWLGFFDERAGIIEFDCELPPAEAEVSGGLGNPRRSECGWAEARTCLRSFPTSQAACTGGPMSDGAASMMLPKSDQPLA
jgi:hypothetical protein